MTYRGWLYRVSLVLITLLLLIPQGYFLFPTARGVYEIGLGYQIYPSIPGLTADNMVYSPFDYMPMWRGNFVQVTPNGPLIRSRPAARWQIVNDYVVEFLDPITQQRIGDVIPLKQGYYRPIVLDGRLFVVGDPSSPNVVTESYEFVDDQLKPFDFSWPGYDPMVLINGKLFRIQNPPSTLKPVLTTVESGAWTSPQAVVTPSFTIPSGLRDNGLSDEVPVLQCLNDGVRIYTFLRNEGKVYCRIGLTLRSADDRSEIKTYGTDGPNQGDDLGPDGAWQQIADKSKVTPNSDNAYFAIVDGSPAALIVEDTEDARPVGHLYKFVGKDWNEATTLQFPLGSRRFRLLSPGNGEAPYIVAGTSTGTGFVYLWETDGIKEVAGQGPASTWKSVKRDLDRHIRFYGNIIGLGLLPCLGICLMISLFTRAEYSFGHCSVKLASLTRRAIAKAIDLALLATVAMTIASLQWRNVNWFEVAESWNLKLQHPDLMRLIQTIFITVVAMAAASLLMIVIQGFWGVTPGKWLCGLKTVRTTLRPCGIARSLVREFLLTLDATLSSLVGARLLVDRPDQSQTTPG